MTEYRNCRIENDSIVGEHDRYGDFMHFRASPSLLRIDLAMERCPKSVRDFWDMQDGYGVAGLTPPQGYDWSGIRDSSDEAIERMHDLAKKIIPDSLFHEILGIEIEGPEPDGQRYLGGGLYGSTSR